MRLRLLAAAAPLALASLALSTPAQAQDFDWTGFYVGGTLGGSWSDTSTSTTATPGNGTVVIPPGDVGLISHTGGESDGDSGFTGSVEAGYNWQFGGFLFGIETDYGWFNIEETRSNSYQSGLAIAPPVTATARQELSTDWIWTLRPRLGWASGAWLFYGTAGIASTKIDYSFDYTDTQATPRTAHLQASDTKMGWTAGLGAAVLLTPQWSVKGEWLYADFGNIRVSGDASSGFAQITSEAEVRANLLRLGVDYKF